MTDLCLNDCPTIIVYTHLSPFNSLYFQKYSFLENVFTNVFLYLGSEEEYTSSQSTQEEETDDDNPRPVLETGEVGV